MLSLSGEGAKFVGAWEGFRSQPYNDSQGNATVGIGHLIHRGPVTGADRARWGSMSRAHALVQLQADMQRNALDALQASLKVKLTVAQIDALCSLAFNCGPRSLAAGRSVMSAVNSKPKAWNRLAIAAWHKRVEAAIMLWAHPSELTRRRRSEAYLFKTGKYTKAAGNPYANA
jgi:lysozyme